MIREVSELDSAQERINPLMVIQCRVWPGRCGEHEELPSRMIDQKDEIHHQASDIYQALLFSNCGGEPGCNMGRCDLPSCMRLEYSISQGERVVRGGGAN
jgi:hypothetical protein